MKDVKFDEVKLLKHTKECLKELGNGLAANYISSMEVTTEELTLPNNRKAQIKVVVQCDPDEFEELIDL